jgi:hypothetical protein
MARIRIQNQGNFSQYVEGPIIGHGTWRQGTFVERHAIKVARPDGTHVWLRETNMTDMYCVCVDGVTEHADLFGGAL